MEAEDTNLFVGQSTPYEIDQDCEKAMLQFVHYHRAAKFVDLDTVWSEFIKFHEIPPDQEGLEISDLKLHYLCMDKDVNKWDLDEEVFMYNKFEGFGEEDTDYTDDLDDSPVKKTGSQPKLLVTFSRKQNLNSGLSLDAYNLAKKAFRRNE